MKKQQNPVFRRCTAIRQAVNNPRCPEYRNVGARGIKIFWKNSREFTEYVLTTLGPPRLGRESKLMRINPDLDYEPGNLMWGTHRLVGDRLKTSHRLTYNGETHSIRQWSEKLNQSIWRMYRLYRQGYTTEQILGFEPTPKRTRRK